MESKKGEGIRNPKKRSQVAVKSQSQINAGSNSKLGCGGHKLPKKFQQEQSRVGGEGGGASA